MIRWSVFLFAAASMSVAPPKSAAAHAMKVGEIRPVTPADVDMVRSINAMLQSKIGGEPRTSGGTWKRITPDLSLACGYYVDLGAAGAAADQLVLGFAILVDKRAAKADVFAPASYEVQEAKGCFPGERERTAKAIRRLDRLMKAPR